MTRAAVDALNLEVVRARELFASLAPDEWEAPSGCVGWRVQDVAQHMAAVFQQIAAPGSLDLGDSGASETSNEVPVQARRNWVPAQVVEAYDEWSVKGMATIAALQEPPTADAVVPITDLGEYPLHLVGNAILFDHYCHLRHDIGAAVPRAAELPRDEPALQATVEWMLAGLPQMCADALAAAPNQPLSLVFDGPGSGSYSLTPGERWTVAVGADDDAPHVRTSAHDFVSWATKRADWRDAAVVDVPDPAVAAVLDAINII